MAKGARPDKQNMVMGMFAKIARDADREEQYRIRQAKKNGEFYTIPHPELLSLKDQQIYYTALSENKHGGPEWLIEYDRNVKGFPFPYLLAKK